MKNIPIRFRGRDNLGYYSFGGFYKNEEMDCTYIITDENYNYGTLDYSRVEPDSVAQLVGYDKNGRKVYEGDIVTDKNCRELTASLVAAGTDSKGFHFKWDKDFELKEKK